MPRHNAGLARAVDAVLLGTMPPTLRALIHDLVGRGVPRAEILRLARRQADPRSLTYQMIGAAVDEAFALAR